MSNVVSVLRTIDVPKNLNDELCAIAASRGVHTNDLIIEILKKWKPPLYVITKLDGRYIYYWDGDCKLYTTNISDATKYTEKQKAELSSLPGINFTEVKE